MYLQGGHLFFNTTTDLGAIIFLMHCLLTLFEYIDDVKLYIINILCILTGQGVMVLN